MEHLIAILSDISVLSNPDGTQNVFYREYLSEKLYLILAGYFQPSELTPY